jgi:hypothetical protein
VAGEQGVEDESYGGAAVRVSVALAGVDAERTRAEAHATTPQPAGMSAGESVLVRLELPEGRLPPKLAAPREAVRWIQARECMRHERAVH